MRVYEVAKQLDVPSKVLVLYLASQGSVVRSASTKLDDGSVQVLLTVQAFEIKTAAIKQAIHDRRQAARQAPERWDYGDDDWYVEEPVWDGPSVLTTPQAARAVGVSAATVRQWMARGHLTPIGRQGRAHLFTAADVMAVDKRTRARVRQPVQSSSRSDGWTLAVDERRGVSSANINDHVTAAEAAYSAGVSPATVRSWVHRGLLATVGRRGRADLFVRLDVIRLARRAPYRPKRKSRHY